MRPEIRQALIGLVLIAVAVAGAHGLIVVARVTQDDYKAYLEIGKTWVDIVNGVAAIAALVIGGWWAFNRFIRERADEWNMQVHSDLQLLPYGADKVLLVVKVNLKNVGKVKIEPAREGCTIDIFPLPADAAPGEKLEEGNVFKHVDVLAPYDLADYWLEPGVEFQETEAIVLPKDKFFTVKTSFRVRDDSRTEPDAITNYQVIHTKIT